MAKLGVLIVALLFGIYSGVNYFFYSQVLGDVREAVRAHGRYDSRKVEKILGSIPRVRGEGGLDPLLQIVDSKKLQLIERQFAQMALWRYRQGTSGMKKLRTFGKIVEATARSLKVDVRDAEAEELSGYLKRKDPAYRIAACEGIALMGKKAPSTLVDSLLETLGSDGFLPVRGEAARALGVLGSKKAVKQLKAIAKDEEGEFARVAIEALGRISGAEARKALESLLDAQPVLAAEALEVRGEREAAGALAKAMKRKDPEIRYAAARALAVIGDPRGVEKLEKGVSPGPNDVRLVALRRSHGIEAPGILKQQVQGASDPDPKVRAAAALALGGNPSELAAGALRSLLTDDEWKVKGAAMRAIADRKDPGFLNILQDQARNGLKDAYRIPAIEGLALLRDRTIVDELRQNLRSTERSDEVKRASWLALKQIVGHAPDVGQEQKTLFEAVQPVEIPTED